MMIMSPQFTFAAEGYRAEYEDAEDAVTTVRAEPRAMQADMAPIILILNIIKRTICIIASRTERNRLMR